MYVDGGDNKVCGEVLRRDNKWSEVESKLVLMWVRVCESK